MDRPQQLSLQLKGMERLVDADSGATLLCLGIRGARFHRAVALSMVLCPLPVTAGWPCQNGPGPLTGSETDNASSVCSGGIRGQAPRRGAERAGCDPA